MSRKLLLILNKAFRAFIWHMKALRNYKNFTDVHIINIWSFNILGIRSSAQTNKSVILLPRRTIPMKVD